MSPSTMTWFYLGVAGALEVGWAITMKYSQGFPRVGPTIATYAMGLASFYFLALATERLPIGTAYAIWTGIGAARTGILGIVPFAEPRVWRRLASLALIVIGIAGLRLAATAAGQP